MGTPLNSPFKRNRYSFNVIDLSTLTPLFSKEGLGEILRNAIKIPLNPPLQRGT